jgi:hypothetical protein
LHKDKTKFIEATERTCPTCSRREMIPFEDPITEKKYHEYIEKNIRCDICGSNRNFKPEYYKPPPTPPTPAPVTKTNEENNNNNTETESCAQKLMQLANDNISLLFKDQFDTPFGSININSHCEIIPLESSKFKRFLSRLYYNEYQDVAYTDALNNSIQILCAKAQFDGPSYELYLRVASSKDKKTIYYDLTNQKYEMASCIICCMLCLQWISSKCALIMRIMFKDVKISEFKNGILPPYFFLLDRSVHL